jgi:uncharacterized membrane protein
VTVDGGGTLTFSSPGWLVPAALLLAAAVAALVWGHRRAPAGRAAAALKVTGLVLLALCLVEPAWLSQRAKPGANLFVVLADNSRGMSLRDRGASQTRGEHLRAEVAGDRPWLQRLSESYQLRRYLFDARLRRSQDFHELVFDGDATQLGAALHTIADRYRGGPLAGIVLLSDGNATDLGDQPFDGRGLPPVYPVVFGGREPQPDIALGNVTVTQTSFEDAPVTVAADVDSAGQAGQTITAELLDADGKVVQSQGLPVTRDDELLTARFRLRPAKTGLSFYRVRVAAPDAREATLANNARLILVERPPGPYRILYVAGRPNWEYKFLRRAVEADPSVQLVALLRVAAREPKFAFRGRGGENTNPLYRGFASNGTEAESYDQPVLVRLGTRDASELAGGFPKTDEELFAYHALVLDDVEAGFFTTDQQARIERFVSDRGGGFLMLGGQDSFRQGHYEHTPIAQLLPVYVDRAPEGQPLPPVKLSLSREGWLEAWTRLRDNEPAERERLDQMPPFRVVNRVRGVKAGATVLATVTPASGTELPALVVQRFGSGRSGALMIGDLWHWALGRAELQPDLARFWRQTTRWLVTDVPERVTVRVERRASDAGQPMAIAVRVRDRAHRPAEDVAVALEVTAPDGEKARFAATPAASEAGVYEATFLPRKAGGYRVRARVTERDGALAGEAEAGWALDLEADEHRSIRANPALLENIARKTGGQMVSVGELEAFARELPRRGAPIAEPRSRPLWHNWPVLLAAFACFAGEWTLRRRRGLA